MKKCFIPNPLVSFLCGMCSRLDEQEALFARVQKSNCAKVMPTVCIMLGLAEWENELNLSNEMHCICFLQKQSHANTQAHKCAWIFDNRYLICVAWLILFNRDVIWIYKDRINTLIPIIHPISNFGASRFLHSQTLPPVHPSVNTYHTKWY